MQVTQPQKFADDLSRLYVQQDYDAIADHYDAPGALYLEDEVIVWTSKDNLITLLRSHCAVNQSLGVRHVTPYVVAQGMPDRQHVTLWVDWLHSDEHGAEIFTFKVRYFCRYGQDGMPVIQLIEVPQQPSFYQDALMEFQQQRRA